MGTFLGHIVPGLALALLGLWHSVNTLRSYFINGPSNFRVAYWFPLNSPSSKFKHTELIFIFSFSILAMTMQILDFPYLSFSFSFKLDNLEHATMFLHVAVFSGLALCAELSESLHALSGLVGILAASVFGQELFLLRFHSADHVGIEGHYHWLLQLAALVSFAAASAAAFSPNSFPAALVLSSAIVFQGCWFMNMGLVLWVPRFVPAGCSGRSAEGGDVVGAVVCGSEGADMRARALANLQFSWVLAGILLLTGLVALRLAGKCRPRELPGEYERLRSKVPEVQIAMNSLRRS